MINQIYEVNAEDLFKIIPKTIDIDWAKLEFQLSYCSHNNQREAVYTWYESCAWWCCHDSISKFGTLWDTPVDCIKSISCLLYDNNLLSL